MMKKMSKAGYMKMKAPARFELAISCLLDRRFNQLSHGAEVTVEAPNIKLLKIYV